MSYRIFRGTEVIINYMTDSWRGFRGMIEKIQQDDAKYGELITGYNSIVLELKNKLKVVPHYFIHFSRHDQSHSEQIIQYIERLLGEENLELLSTSDKMMIALSCYAHDVGMSIDHAQIDALFSKEDFADILQGSMDTSYDDVQKIVDNILNYPDSFKGTKDAYQLYVDVGIVIENVFRRDHAKRSADYILKSESIKNVLGDRCTKHLAAICKMHDQNPDDIMGMPYRENGFFNDYFHPRFIASLLCLGDLMDMDTDRFDMNILKASSGMPMLSELHKKKHESVTRYLVETSRIEIGANCESVQVYRIMRQWMDWMKSVTDFMLRNWDEITPNKAILPPRIKKCDILINNNARWIGYANTKIQVDAKKAVKLLQGSNIYQGKEVFVRELIQNAMDASLIQLFLDCEQKSDGSVDFETVMSLIEKGKINIHDYDIEGRLYIKDNKSIFELTDHGTGISDSEIPVIAGLRGKSKRLKDIIKKIPEMLRPSGAFGIGLQSAFQVAEKIEFYTKTSDEATKKITIDDPGTTGYIYVEDCTTNMPRGTRVVVTLDDNKFTQTDLSVSDYVFNTKDKCELINDWLYREWDATLYYLDKEKRQTMDYFNLSIVGKKSDYEAEKEIINRMSILGESEDDIEKIGFASLLKHHKITMMGGSLWYKKLDINSNCIFEARIPYESQVAEFVKNGKMAFGSLGVVWQDYSHSLLYRNVLVGEHEISYGMPCIHNIFKVLDYRLNLFSDAADDVLTLDRRNVLDSYRDKLSTIVVSEIKDLCHNLIDEFLGEDTKWDKSKAGNVFVFLLYFMAHYSEYRVDEMEKNFESLINGVNISNFWKTSTDEEMIPLNEIRHKDIYFYAKLDEGYNKISSETWKAVMTPIDDMADAYIIKRKSVEKHLLYFTLESEFLSEINNTKVYVYKVKTLLGENNKSGIEVSGVLQYLEMLRIIFLGQRCTAVPKGHESLATPIVDGIKSKYMVKNLMLELTLDDTISKQMQEEIALTKHIESADKYVELFAETECFKKNIDFIHGHHPKRERFQIEGEYKKLLKELLLLFEKKEYEEFFDLVFPSLQKKEPFPLYSLDEHNSIFDTYEIIKCNCLSD